MTSRRRVDPCRLATALPTRSTIRLRVLSLGAGIQPIARMAARGIIDPMPDYAVFADTGSKPTVVYDHLASPTSPNVLPFLGLPRIGGQHSRESDQCCWRSAVGIHPRFTRAVNRPRPSAVLAGGSSRQLS